MAGEGDPEDPRLVRLSEGDLPRIGEAMKRQGAELLVVDALKDHLQSGLRDKDEIAVRGQLSPINRWARQSGTAVLGIVGALDNEAGVIGIAPKVAISVACNTGNLPNALSIAVNGMDFSDVLLIEAQLSTNLPVETEGLTWTLIQSQRGPRWQTFFLC